MKSKSNRIVFRAVAVCALLALTAAQSQADLSGSLSTSDGGLDGSWGTGESTLSWDVELLKDGWFRYTYTLTVPGGPEFSHVIFEVSENFTLGNIRDLTWNGAKPAAKNVYLFSNYWNSGNPGMPSEADWNNSIKVDETYGRIATLMFESDRVPVWGDFYAKGGSSYLYNSGLGYTDPPDAAADGVHWTQLDTGASVAHLLVPDTYTHHMPLPGAMLLGSLGLAVASHRLRRRQV